MSETILDAERSMLGMLLKCPPDIADRICDAVEPEDLRDHWHRRVYDTARQLHAVGKPIDGYTVAEAMRRAGQLEDRDAARIVDLRNHAPLTWASLPEILATIGEAAERYRLDCRLTDGLRAVRDPAADLDDVRTTLVGDLLADRDRTDCWTPIGDIVPRVVERAEQRRRGELVDQTVTTGFTALDTLLDGGMRPGELLIIGARPSVGKTAIGTAMATAAALTGTTALFVSLEMSAEQIACRIAAERTGVAFCRLRRSDFAATDGNALLSLRGLSIDICEPKSDRLSRLLATIRRRVRSRSAGLVVVDYLGLVRPDHGRERDTAYALMTEASASLKRLARELGLPVVVLAQLNRQGADGRPTMAHLRDSGAIEQDADVVMLLWRPEEDDRSIVCCEVAKNRNGRCGRVTLAFDGPTASFVREQEAVA